MIRKWVPADYVDETAPEARNAPEDWLVDHPDGGKALAPFWDDDPLGRPLIEGEVVEMMWIEDFGSSDVTVTWVDGEQVIQASTEMPADPPGGHMMAMVELDPDSCDLSLADVLQGYDPGEYRILYYAWCDRSIPFVFTNGGLQPRHGQRVTP